MLARRLGSSQQDQLGHEIRPHPYGHHHAEPRRCVSDSPHPPIRQHSYYCYDLEHSQRRHFDVLPARYVQPNAGLHIRSILTSTGMNDVLPKPFTKEGLVNMLDKHLSHLKKQPAGLDPMGAPPAPLSGAKRSLKSEDSPVTSPAAASNWNSPGAMAGVSPASNHPAEDPHMYAVHNQAQTAQYGVQPQMYGQPPPQHMRQPPPQMQHPQPQPPGPHRRGVSEMAGGPVEMGDAKRQQMYGQPMGQHMPPQQQGMQQQNYPRPR